MFITPCRRLHAQTGGQQHARPVVPGCPPAVTTPDATDALASGMHRVATIATSDTTNQSKASIGSTSSKEPHANTATMKPTRLKPDLVANVRRSRAGWSKVSVSTSGKQADQKEANRHRRHRRRQNG